MDITGVKSGANTRDGSCASRAGALAENRDIVQAVKALNAASSFGDNNELSFMLDRNTKLPVIRIVNSATKEVVEQIPAEYILQLAQELGQR